MIFYVAQKNHRYILSFVMAWFLVLVLLLTMFVYSIWQPSKNYHRLPIASYINGIATDGIYIYTIDTSMKNICKFDQAGVLLYRIKYADTGRFAIFCNAENKLCRYNKNTGTITVYDAEGIAVDTYTRYKNEGEPTSDMQKVIVNGDTYILQSNGSVCIVRGGTETIVHVERGWQKIFLPLWILLIAGVMAFGIFNGARFYYGCFAAQKRQAQNNR